jgi:protoheme IX farnesyltransferase
LAPPTRAPPEGAADYLALTKPRLVTIGRHHRRVGFYLGAPGRSLSALFLNAMIGNRAGGGRSALALNQYLERDLDACMDRNAQSAAARRASAPPPGSAVRRRADRARPRQLLLLVNPLACAVTAVTSAVYLFMYTPLKRVTPALHHRRRGAGRACRR